jgi:hypothetical protein
VRNGTSMAVPGGACQHGLVCSAAHMFNIITHESHVSVSVVFFLTAGLGFVFCGAGVASLFWGRVAFRAFSL